MLIYLYDLLEEKGKEWPKEFSFSEYHEGERKFLTPLLKEMGFTVIRWTDGERDSFGPLSRVAKCVGGDEVWYG